MKNITFACLALLMLNSACTTEEHELTIGFGSCNEPEQTQHLLPTLNQALDSLDHFIWLGDNIYLETGNGTATTVLWRDMSQFLDNLSFKKY